MAELWPSEEEEEVLASIFGEDFAAERACVPAVDLKIYRTDDGLQVEVLGRSAAWNAETPALKAALQGLADAEAPLFDIFEEARQYVADVGPLGNQGARDTGLQEAVST